MALNTNTITLISVVLGFIGMAWAIFWPVRGQFGSGPVSTHWDIVYVDDDGIMQFTLVRVIKVNPSTRRMTAWCATRGAERVFKLSKIVKATDVRSGMRINVDQLMDRPRTLARSRPCQPDGSDLHAAHSIHSTQPPHSIDSPDSSGWWSASNLGLH